MDQPEGLPLDNLTPQGGRANQQQVDDAQLGLPPPVSTDPKRGVLDPFIDGARSAVEKISSGFTKLRSRIVVRIPRRGVPRQASATSTRPNTNRLGAAILTALKEFWNRAKSLFNYLKTSFSKPGSSAITNCLIAIVGIILTVIALIPAYQTLKLTEWDTRKEFLKTCTEHIELIAAETRAVCDTAIKKGLQPPPYMGASISSAGYSRKFLLREIHTRQDNCARLGQSFSPEAFFLALPTLSTGAAIGIGILLVLFYFVWMLNATYLLKRYIHENILLKTVRRYQSAPGPRPLFRRPRAHFFWSDLLVPSARCRPIEYANLITLLIGFLILAGVATLFPQAVYWLYSRKLKITASLVYDNLQTFCNTYTGLTLSACKSNVQPPRQRAALGTVDVIFLIISFSLSFLGVPVGVAFATKRVLIVQELLMDEEASEMAPSRVGVPTGDVGATTPENLNEDGNGSEIALIAGVTSSDSLRARETDSPTRDAEDDGPFLSVLSSRERSRGRRRVRARPSATASGAATATSSATAWKDLTPAGIRRALLQVPDEHLDQIFRVLQRRRAIRSRQHTEEEEP